LDKGIDWNEVLKPVPKSVIKEEEEIKNYSVAMRKAKCPKCQRNRFKVFEDVDGCSDGEIKSLNLRCIGTESSPCSDCSGNSINVWMPDPSPPKIKKSEFAQAKGFREEDCEGEEDGKRLQVVSSLPLHH